MIAPNVDAGLGNYVGSLLTYKISGYITNSDTTAIEDVLVSADSGGGLLDHVGDGVEMIKSIRYRPKPL